MNYAIEIITCVTFNTNFLRFAIIHFYIVSTAIYFLVLTYALYNDSK